LKAILFGCARAKPSYNAFKKAFSQFEGSLLKRRLNIKTGVSNIQADWKHPTEIRFGVGRIKELPEACQKLGMRNPLLVTGPVVARLPFIEKMLESNRNAGIETRIFSKITSEPDSGCIKKGARIFKQGQFDGIIAVGGGSTLDAGKAIALAVAVGQKYLWNYRFGSKIPTTTPRKIHAVIAIPTTAGAGSEVNASAVIIDDLNHVKISLYHPKLLPKIVIADPELTRRLTPYATAAAGMDALSHNLEALCSPAFNPMLDAIALQGIRYLKDWLPIAFREGRNLQARVYTMAASIMGPLHLKKDSEGCMCLRMLSGRFLKPTMDELLLR
jgi:alcohol dehydrogenase class IV